ncbi:hypothetical protein NIES4101_70910 [Calothrix sp. NIES-4101]|nr:hypothetical protein NIES4101_70910 [Calothrix sp. NIES-4101]
MSVIAHLFLLCLVELAFNFQGSRYKIKQPFSQFLYFSNPLLVVSLNLGIINKDNHIRLIVEDTVVQPLNSGTAYLTWCLVFFGICGGQRFYTGNFAGGIALFYHYLQRIIVKPCHISFLLKNSWFLVSVRK